MPGLVGNPTIQLNYKEVQKMRIMGQFCYSGNPEEDQKAADDEKEHFLRYDLFKQFLTHIRYSEEDIRDLDVEEWVFLTYDFRNWYNEI